MNGERRIYRLEAGAARETALETCFPFLHERGHVISLVGGGGKTSLMETLAKAYCARGMKTVAMTTTRIFCPPRFARTMEECRMFWAAGEYAVCGEPVQQGKLGMPKAHVLDALLAQADAVLIEADGAKRMACKAPAPHEPVILPQSDIVIGVVGAPVLGGRVDEVCFRAQYVCAALGCEGEHILTAEDLAGLLLSEQGTRKGVFDRDYYVAINKCDDEARIQKAIAIAQALLRRGHARTALTCLQPERKNED